MDRSNDPLNPTSGYRLTASVQGDLFEYYARAIQAANGLEVNAAAIAAANAQIQ